MADTTNAIQRDIEIIGELNFAFLAQPFPSKKDDGTTRMVYKTQIILDPSTAEGLAQVQKIKLATREVSQAAWPEDWEQVLQRLAATDKIALHKGDLQDLAKYPEYTGKVFVSTTYNPKPGTSTKPPCVATLGSPPVNVMLEPGHKCFPYSGCKAAVHVSLYAQSPKRKPVSYGPRIVCQLKGVQFLAHGTQRGGGGARIASMSEFAINPLDGDSEAPPVAGNDDANDLI